MKFLADMGISPKTVAFLQALGTMLPISPTRVWSGYQTLTLWRRPAEKDAFCWSMTWASGT